METEVTVACRLIGISLSPAKKEMIVMFFNHFVAAFMLSVLSPSDVLCLFTVIKQHLQGQKF